MNCNSIINYVSKAELTQYTIQDIVVTHRLSYSQNQDRSPKEAYDIAKIIGVILNLLELQKEARFF